MIWGLPARLLEFLCPRRTTPEGSFLQLCLATWKGEGHAGRTPGYLLHHQRGVVAPGRGVNEETPQSWWKSQHASFILSLARWASPGTLWIGLQQAERGPGRNCCSSPPASFPPGSEPAKGLRRMDGQTDGLDGQRDGALCGPPKQEEKSKTGPLANEFLCRPGSFPSTCCSAK